MKQIKKFNELFLISYILFYIGAIPNQNACTFRYGSEVLYFEYFIIIHDVSHTIEIYQNDDGTIDIVFPTFIAHTAFDCYLYAICNSNMRSALSWEKNNSLLNGNNVKPLLDMNSICDSTKQQPFRQQLSFCIARNSRLMRYAQKLNAITHIPINTIILVILGIYSGMTSRCFNVGYKDGKTTPIGLYVFPELSSGTSKSWLVDFLVNPMKQAIERKVKQKKSVIRVDARNT